MKEEAHPEDQTGPRIRDLRLAQGRRQADLARQAGISPAYLNLIEHGRRRIAGGLVARLAEALEVPVGELRRSGQGGLGAALESAARQMERPGALAAPFAARFPDWAELVAAQSERITALEGRLAAMGDRMAHDPEFAASLHELLSTITSIRSTASILARGEDLDADWQGRFQQNLFADAQRLVESSSGLMRRLEAQSRPIAPPEEQVERFFAQFDGAPPGIEAGEAEAPEAALDGSARRLAARHLARMRADAAALPLGPFAEAARRADYDPFALAPLAGGDLALVLRRLAMLRQRQGHPRFGLAICDGAGRVGFRRALDQIAVPRSGPVCPHWPLFTALGAPGQPLREELSLGGGIGLTAWAVATRRMIAPPPAPPALEAVMLLRHMPAPAPGALMVGEACPICAEGDAL